MVAADSYEHDTSGAVRLFVVGPYNIIPRSAHKKTPSFKNVKNEVFVHIVGSLFVCFNPRPRRGDYSKNYWPFFAASTLALDSCTSLMNKDSQDSRDQTYILAIRLRLSARSC